MSFSIQTNVNSLVAQENLRVNSNFQSQTIQRLTSGYRINSSGDDAAGLAVANKFRSDTAELTQGVRNANDATSQLQIIDGGMSNIGKMLDRLKTLATQSASDSFTGNRGVLNSEYQTLIGEINRQAQSIGLNQGGSFAKSLSIYVGGGAGATASAISANGTLGIDLAQATVDAQSLGLSGVQAVNSNTYNLAASSATSVSKILADAGNGAASGGAVATTKFTFYGAGFANNDGNTSYTGIDVTVNLNGVSDTSSLVNAINAGIQAAAAAPNGAASKFKAAGVVASIKTDANGNQMLAFSSAQSSFEVQATDRTSNALMGNFGTDGTSAATGRQMASTVTAGAGLAATAARNLTAAAAQQKLTFFGSGISNPAGVTITLDGNYSAADADLGTAINTKLAAAGVTGITATSAAGSLSFASTTGTFSVSAQNNSGGTDALGLVSSTSAIKPVYSGTSNYADFVSSGTYEMGATSASGVNSVKNFTFAATTGTQAITLSANDATGASHGLTVKLANGSTGASISAAVTEINKQLQMSNDSTLQQITAVAVNDNGIQKINFVSTLSDFSVSLGTDTTGMKDGNGLQGTTTKAVQVGSGSAGDISSAAGAKQAVTALTAAVQSLGIAQAAVGKGENQLSYAIGLAQSQISNFSSAQAQIRDTDVAAEAANLSKAQVLQQASIAAMAQANSAPQAVLSLLRG